MSLGASELFLVLLVILLLFGGKRLPELARNLGRGVAEFRRATTEIRREINVLDETPATRATTPTRSPSTERTILDAPAHSQPRDASTESRETS
ncbi:twin-arginine translocase TatA/TatE family subunit [bacterium]|nr:twin-arginine translocase TatA/TatE family subunit [bacterium]